MSDYVDLCRRPVTSPTERESQRIHGERAFDEEDSLPVLVGLVLFALASETEWGPPRWFRVLFRTSRMAKSFYRRAVAAMCAP